MSNHLADLSWCRPARGVRGHRGAGGACVELGRSARVVARMLSSSSRGVVVAVVAAMCVMSVVPSGALASFETRFAEHGQGAGQLEGATGVAVDTSTGAPSSGRVYVADTSNHRISVFDESGRFVEAWGWGVANGADEPQTCTSVCRAGLTGSEAGEFGGTGSRGGMRVAVDDDPSSAAFHDVYVYDMSNNRVERFSYEGQFQLAFGWGVRDGAAEPQTCGPQASPPTSTCLAGIYGSGAGQLAEPPLSEETQSYEKKDTGQKENGRNQIEEKVLRLYHDSAGAGALAVDSTGTVWLAQAERIERFDADGDLVSELSLPGQQLDYLALDPTDDFYTGPSGESERIELLTYIEGESSATLKEKSIIKFLGGELSKFGPTAARVATLSDPFGPAPWHLAVAIDEAGDLFVSDFNESMLSPTLSLTEGHPATHESGSAFLEFNAADEEVEQWDVHTGPGRVDEVTGMAFSPSAKDLFFVGEEGGFRLTLPGPGPQVRGGGESATSGSVEARAAAIVNPEGQATEARFQYIPEAGFKEDGESFGAGTLETAESGSIGADFGEYSVSARMGQLRPETAYRYRVVADSECEAAAHPGKECVAYGEGGSFTTGPVASFSVLPIAEPGRTSATVTMLVDPDGQASTVRLLYGSESVGEHVTAAQPVAAAEGYVPVSVGLTGLAPGVSYRVRLRLENEAGSAEAQEESFTTAGGVCPNEALRTGFSAALGECRAYEQVTPVEKGGVPPQAAIATEVDGEALAYSSQAPEPGSAAGTVSDYVSRRGSSGWQTTGITPPTLGRASLSLTGQPYVRDVSPDLSTAVMQTSYPIDPEAQGYDKTEEAQPVEVYLREADGRFVWVSRPAALPDISPYEATFAGASRDLSHIFFTTRESLTAQTQGSTAENLYEYSDGEVRSVNLAPASEGEGLLPGGATVGGTLYGGGGETSEHPEIGQPFFRTAVSEDGSTVFFDAGGELYVRRGGRTEEVSLSQRPGSVGEPAEGGAQFMVATPDDSAVLFYSAAQLTEGAPSGGGFYQYTVASSSLSFVAQGEKPEEREIVGATADLSYVYYVGFQEYIYMLHDGAVTRVGQEQEGEIAEGEETTAKYEASVSPNGRYLVFAGNGQWTPYENEEHVEVYEYDAVSGSTVCVSCQPGGQAPQGHSSLYPEALSGFTEIQPPVQLHVVTDDGTVFFDSSSRLVPRDENGQEDVYEYHDGVVSLVSSGSDPNPSALFGVSEDGSNVFFFTFQSLVAQDIDGGVADIYDARVDGGFPAPVESSACLSGEECRGALSLSSAPFGEPGSLLFSEPAGGVAAVPSAVLTPAVRKKESVKCAKGHARVHGRCVKTKRRGRSRARHQRKRAARGGGRGRAGVKRGGAR